MAIRMSDNKRDIDKFRNTSPTWNNLSRGIYNGEDAYSEYFYIESSISMRREIGNILFHHDLLLREPYHKQYEFVVGHTGAYALPLNDCSFSVERVKREMTPEHREEYDFCVTEGLRDYVALIQKNKDANKSYKIPEFTLEKATELAEEAFKLSFERTRESYTIK